MLQPKILNPDKGRFFKSVIFRAWISFLSLAVVIIAIMATIFVVVYTFTYRNQKINGIVNAGNYVISSYPQNESELGEFEELLDEIVVVNNMSVVVFTTPEQLTPQTTFDGIDIKVSRIWSGDDSQTKVNLQAITSKFFDKLAKNDSNFYFSVNNKKYDGADIIIGGQRTVNGEKVYFCVHSFVKNQDYASSFFYQLFLGMSIIAFIVSIIYAYFIGKKITYPLVKLSQEVRKIGKNENYRFELDKDSYIEINDLAYSLEELLKEQQKTEHFRRDIVANVSHDLRTPLTMIKAYAEMIRDLSGNNPQKREEHCDIIINEVDTLNELVSDLLDLSKLQADTVQLDLKRVNLTCLVKTVLDRLDIFKERDGYEFITDVDENCYCVCDSKRIEQAIYNLVCNAINYTGADKKVYVTLKEKDGKLRFSVRDTGKGIKQDELNRIWDRYYRANQTKRSVAGSGIGLSIVQNVLIRHDMDFGVESKEGEGSVFWFESNATKQ